MNGFDAIICFAAVVAVMTGYSAGLLRSMATILGYLCAMPVAVALTALIAPTLPDKANSPWTQNSFILFGIFLAAGILIGNLLRVAISEMVGPTISIPDRVAGSALGAVRVVLVAVTIVLIFDQLIPADRQPAFLNGSRLRPLFSFAGQKGLKSLPPDVTAYIDQLKRERRL